MTQNLRNLVFISYSHKDKEWLDRLRTTLKPLERRKALSVWDDTTIKPGERWPEELERALSQAKVAVMLVSTDFLASDFIQDNELPTLIKAAETEGVAILWIAVSASMYEVTELTRYQCVNDPAKPLDSLSGPEQRAELVQIGRIIMSRAEAIAQAAGHPSDFVLQTPRGAQRNQRFAPLLSVGLIGLLLLAIWLFVTRPATPALIGDVERVKVTKNPNSGVRVFILLSIKNFGPPTLVHKYSLRISHITSKSIDFKGPPYELKESYTLPGMSGGENIVVQPQDAIQSKTARALVDKVNGWMMFELPNPQLTKEFLDQPGIRYSVSFADAGGRTYEANYIVK